jgi:hypothetical protein
MPLRLYQTRQSGPPAYLTEDAPIMLPIQAYKDQQLATLPSGIGVYALCDLDEVPIYVGQSIDGIRARVRRHLTSARSDVIANRQIDVWEIAWVWAWEVMPTATESETKAQLALLEAHLYWQFHANSPLVNGDIPSQPATSPSIIPAKARVEVIPADEVRVRRAPVLRFPRQIQHFNQLVDYILNTQDKPHLRQALQVYFDRLSKYYTEFLTT